MADVPIVDIARPDATALADLDAACRHHGFFLLRGHGLDEVIERTQYEAAGFFAASERVRAQFRRSGESPFGYNDRELTKGHRDRKQVFDFIDPNNDSLDAMNQWPADDGFRATMADFHRQMGTLVEPTMTLLHDALALGDMGRETMQGASQGSVVRLNRYPGHDPVPQLERVGLADLGPTALGHHTDPGVITLLVQDDVGGLQTRTRDGDWLDVAPSERTIVVNLGDAVQVWTNDRYIAAVHRVVSNKAETRSSIAQFVNPARGAVIEPLGELTDGQARYRPFRWSDFANARNADNVADLGVPDAQISDYAIAGDSP